MEKLLRNEINYQENSIVSKHLIKENTGNITLFALSKDEKISEHTTPFDAFVFVLEGEIKITLDKNAHVLTKDDFLIMPTNIPHALYGIENCKFMLIMIKNIIEEGKK
jgi:quercetin dioxygenase-like cupin family protein